MGKPLGWNQPFSMVIPGCFQPSFAHQIPTVRSLPVQTSGGVVRQLDQLKNRGIDIRNPWKVFGSRHLFSPYHPCMVYLPTFTIKINQMLVNIPYMDPLGPSFFRWSRWDFNIFRSRSMYRTSPFFAPRWFERKDSRSGFRGRIWKRPKTPWICYPSLDVLLEV